MFGKLGHLLSDCASRLIFSERHVSRDRFLANTDTFCQILPQDWFFLNNMYLMCYWGIFECIFLYLAMLHSRSRPLACLARSAARITLLLKKFSLLVFWFLLKNYIKSSNIWEQKLKRRIQLTCCQKLQLRKWPGNCWEAVIYVLIRRY